MSAKRLCLGLTLIAMFGIPARVQAEDEYDRLDPAGILALAASTRSKSTAEGPTNACCFVFRRVVEGAYACVCVLHAPQPYPTLVDQSRQLYLRFFRQRRHFPCTSRVDHSLILERIAIAMPIMYLVYAPTAHCYSPRIIVTPSSRRSIL